MQVVQVSKITEEEVAGGDFSFDVDSVIAKPYTHLSGPEIRTVSVAKYSKTWDAEDEGFSAAKDASDRAIFALVHEGRVYGYIYAFKDWNNLVTLHNFGVERSARRGGNGRRLFHAAVNWARDIGVKALRIEMQDNNVGACRFYKSVGCVFGGFDEFLYRGTEHADEVAIFWYYLF